MLFRSNAHSQIGHPHCVRDSVLVAEHAAEGTHALSNQMRSVLLAQSGIQLVELAVGIGNQALGLVNVLKQERNGVKGKAGIHSGLHSAVEEIQLSVPSLHEQLRLGAQNAFIVGRNLHLAIGFLLHQLTKLTDMLAVAIIIGRERGVGTVSTQLKFIDGGIRLIAAERGRVIAAAWSGKIKTAATMVFLMLMFLPLPGWVDTLGVWVIVVTTVYSGLEYLVKNKDVIDWSKL